MTVENHAFQEAVAYFDALWEQAQRSLDAGDIPAAGRLVPLNYCVSTVARLIQQPGSLAERVDHLKQTLMNRVGDQFFYSPDSLHISLLGCTPRLPSKDSFPSHQIEKIRRICIETLSGAGQMRFHLKGLGLVGSQVFIQVYPYVRTWAVLRDQLGQALITAGEQPITYANKAPIHLNLMRITDNSPGQIEAVAAALRDLHEATIGDLDVVTIDYLITDFVLSDFHVLSEIRLNAPSGDSLQL